MPKSLFYAGVIFCALFALLVASGVIQSGTTPGLDGLLYDPAASELAPVSPSVMIAVLLMMIPVASILLRMASLVAARNLFAAFFGIFSVSCAALALGYFAALQFRIGTLIRTSSEAITRIQPLLESQVAVTWSFGWFLSLALLSLRPYFRIQASRTLSALVFLPAPVFLWALMGTAGQVAGTTSSTMMLYWSLLAAIFLAISVHCMRHRHLFIEVTNLRELLDTRVVPPLGDRRRLSFDGGVAFDS